MPKTKQIPLEQRLTQLLALRSPVTLRAAMHYTGVIPPRVKGGVLICAHGGVTAADGRCLLCKREADQRLYRNRMYRKAMASLVEKGIAKPSGTDLWTYTGRPAMPVSKSRPKLPAEPRRAVSDVDAAVRAMADRIAAIAGSLAGLSSVSRLDANHSRVSVAYTWAVLGRRLPGHEICSDCGLIETRSRNGHDNYEDDDGNTPAETVRMYGERQRGHADCAICDEIGAERLAADTARAERVERYERERARGRRYPHMPDGRRINSDGSLCDCERCDERVETRRTRVPTLAEQLYTISVGGTTPTPVWTWTIDGLTIDNSYEAESSLRCMDRLRDHPVEAALADRACGYAGHMCYARRGHEGTHMGWSSPSHCAPYAMWPQFETMEVDNRYEPNDDMRCRDSMESHPLAVAAARAAGHGGYYACYARRGHTGNHVGWYGPGDADEWAHWPQAVTAPGTPQIAIDVEEETP